jgi:hypothetical protein
MAWRVTCIPQPLEAPLGAVRLTGEPVAPSCSRTLTMSMGWMMQVASMPEAPPFTKGFTVFQAPLALGTGTAGGSACLAAMLSDRSYCGVLVR